MNSPIEPKACSRCGAPLTPGALQGLCPRCLLALNVATQTEMTGDDAGPQGTKVVPSPAPPTPEEIARHFPALEILELLGRGGMGAVYKARQKQLDRLVALKILPPRSGDDSAFAERFTREAKALARLNHPGIVTLYEFGKVDPQPLALNPQPANGLYYFLMEFVDGVNLRQLLAAGRIAPREALAIVPQICDALQYAHDQGIVHRDIKPENILLDRRGRVKVADFGLAKLVEGRAGSPLPAETDLGAQGTARPTSLTEAGKIMGTPQYMSPEQIQAPSEVDHRADIYALGVVFYQMLTGELPGKPLEPPSSKVQIDVRLDEVVLHALEKDPQRRYQQVSEVKTAVETISAQRSKANLPAQAAVPSTGNELVPQAQAVKNRLRLASAALFIAGCICLGLAVLVNSLTGLMSVDSAQATMAFLRSLHSGFLGGPAKLVPQSSFLLGLLSPLVGVLALVCAWQIRRLQGFALAVTASVLSILYGVMTAPLGLAALVVLCQKKVRAAFKAQTELEAMRGPSATDARAGYKLALTSAVLTLLSVAVAPIYGMMGQGVSGVSGPAAFVAAVIVWLTASANRASLMLGWLALWAMRRSTGRAKGLGYAVLGICFAPILQVFRLFHPGVGAFWIQPERDTSQIPTNMLLALLVAGLLAWGASAWKSRLAASGATASAFMRRLYWTLGIMVLAYAGTLVFRLPALRFASWPGNGVSRSFYFNHRHVQPRPESNPGSFTAHTPLGTLEVQAVSDPEQPDWTCWLPDGTPWCPQTRQASPAGVSQLKHSGIAAKPPLAPKPEVTVGGTATFSTAPKFLLSPKPEDKGHRELIFYLDGSGDLKTNLDRLHFECYVTNRGAEQLCPDNPFRYHNRYNYHGMVARVPAQATAARLRLGVLAGTWEDTDASWAWTGDPRKLKPKSIRHAGEDWEVGIPSVHATAEGLSVVFDWPLSWNGTPRLVAVDTDGKVHEPVWPPGQGYLGISGLREMMGVRESGLLVFPGMDVAQLKELRFQIQPYLWTEFRNVSLQPGAHAQVEVVDAVGAAIAPPPGLVAWWLLDGNAADVVGGHSGTLEGSYTFRSAEVGQGIYLEGEHSGISVPDSPDLNFGPDQDFSIEAWIQPLPSQTSFDVMDIVDKREAPNLIRSHGYTLSVRNGMLGFQISDSLEAPMLDWEQNGRDLRDGLWHHVAATVQRASTNGVNLYVDGEVIATFDPTPARGDLATEQPLLIGMHPSYPWYQGNFKGGLDEVSLYKRALSRAEIQAIFAAGKKGKRKPEDARDRRHGD